MLCQNCHQKSATVHVTEIVPRRGTAGNGSEPAPDPSDSPAPQLAQVLEQHLCEICAQSLSLPNHPVVKKTMSEIWDLLQKSAQQARKHRGVACKQCGMTLEEFRRQGRLGCPRCYEAFGEQVGDLLERVHGARRHEGRLPGLSDDELDRQEHLAVLRRKLEVAVREEDYETAAGLRDEIQLAEQAGSRAEEAAE